MMHRFIAVGLIAGCVASTAGCGRAHANRQTLVTHNCGVSWDLISVGSTVPAMIGPCSYKVTVPDYPMQD